MGAAAEQHDVVLVSMPFAPLPQPSLALSLLQQTLPSGSATILYENLRFGEALGWDLYTRISSGEPATTSLIGEWIFAGAAFGPDDVRDRCYVERFLAPDPSHDVRSDRRTTVDDTLLDGILGARALVAAYIEEALHRVLGPEPTVIGFTSVFQQHVASLALARRIKALSPATTIVFGGANCEGRMGVALLRNFPWVDVVVDGEGERPFPELVERASSGRPLAGVPGAIVRRDLSPLSVRNGDRSAVAVAMDALPVPSFDDFFTQWSASPLSAGHTPFLLFESSRGCWWGELRHCTFCGLNGDRMAFRSKSPERAVDELCELTDRHPGLPVYAVDNIMDRRYFDEFLPRLAASRCDARLFYEVKAQLTKDQLRALRSAGVLDIQPGIESLHDSVLRLMRKGVTALQNVQLLKWCAELGIRPHWNLLWGFPGEPALAYDEMAALIPHLTHLQPPVAAGRIRLDRFSPHFDDAAAWGLCDVRPAPAYELIYGLPRAETDDLAYFFEFGYVAAQPAEQHVRRLSDAVEGWHAAHGDSALWCVETSRSVLVWDLRPGAASLETELTGLERALFVACDTCRTAPELLQIARRSLGEPVSIERLGAMLAPLVAAGLIAHDGRRYLALATWAEDRRPRPDVMARFAHAIAETVPSSAMPSGE